MNRQAASAASYDEVPYDSHAFSQTNPLLLQGIMQLYGLPTPSPEHARILEIGCASGANILSIASCYPQAQCVGFDYSSKQIEAGRKEMEASDVKNLELLHLSVMDVTKEFGTFDYIICHGVLSWVPEEVQDKILDVCKTNLAPDGVAYLSYNTLPGWNDVRSLRDMMLLHTQRFPDAKTKLQQARSLLQAMGKGTEGGMISDAIAREIDILKGQPDDYLMHEYLGEYNTAFYFCELMAKAQARGLAYVSDTSIEAVDDSGSPDIICREQDRDVFCNRRFRRSLLCHAERQPNHDITPDRLRGSWIVSRVADPANYQGIDSSDPMALALLQVLFERKSKPVCETDLAGMVQMKLAEATGANVRDLLMRILFIGGITLFAGKPPYVSQVSEKPVASPLARYQAGQRELVSNQIQECMYLIPFDRFLVGYLDGTRDVAALADCMMPYVVSKEGRLEDRIRERLAMLCGMGLLVA